MVMRRCIIANIGATSSSSRVANVSNPTIQNITVVANTQVTVTLPAGSRRFSIRHRSSSKFEVRYVELGTEYYTNMPGNVYQQDGLAATTAYTLYITPTKAGVLEVESWA